MNLRTALVMTVATVALPSVESRAQSASTLKVAWENAGQTEASGGALRVAGGDGIVAASGAVCSDPAAAPPTCNWFVRALDPKTGATLWEDRVDAGAFDTSSDVVVDDGRVIASGRFQPPIDPVTRTGSFQFVVRAYDANTGVLLWQQRLDRGTSQDVGESLAADKGRVFAVGRTRGSTGSTDFAVVAFDAATGEELWESVTNVFLFDTAVAVTVDRDSVFVAGQVGNGGSVLVRAHDARTGAIRWEDDIQDGVLLVSEPNRLATMGGALYLAGGIITANGDEDGLIRAYDEDTGMVLWTTQVDQRGDDESLGVTARGDQLFVVGMEGLDADGVGFRTTRALDRRTGQPLWLDSFQLAPGYDAYATSVLVTGGTVWTGGLAQDATGVYQWSARTYDAPTGTLLNRDEATVGAINSLAVYQGRVLAAGFIGNSNAQFAVRAYRIDSGR